MPEDQVNFGAVRSDMVDANVLVLHLGVFDSEPIGYFLSTFCGVNFEVQAFDENMRSSWTKEIELLKAKTEKLKEQKKGMMQVLLTGKKRLKIINQ